jgi:hypothetical protein
VSKSPRVWLSSSWRYAGFAFGVAAVIAGLWVLVPSLIDSDPGRVAASAIRADATILAQSQKAIPSSEGRFGPGARTEYSDTFSYIDAEGVQRSATAIVGAAYYNAHGVGAVVDAYYRSGSPDQAALGTPTALGQTGNALPIGGALLLVGGILIGITFETVAGNAYRAIAFRRRRI